jgi:hypothetical protein
MKPVQRAVKDVSKSISDSPLYHAALRPSNPNTSANTSFGFTSPQSLAPPFQGGGGGGYQGNFTASLNTALAQSQAIPLGPPTSVPATPLAAALGPAAQATLSYPSQQSQGEYFSSHSAAGSNVGVRGMHERLDTMIQHPVGAGGPHHSSQSYAQQQQQQHQQYSNYAGAPHTARRMDMNRQN